jgi:hypothetical protein
MGVGEGGGEWVEKLGIKLSPARASLVVLSLAKIKKN